MGVSMGEFMLAVQELMELREGAAEEVLSCATWHVLLKVRIINVCGGGGQRIGCAKCGSASPAEARL